MRTIGACIIVAALCGAALTGCGGSPEESAAAGDATPTADADADADRGDFVARAESLCRYLAVRFAVDLRAALSDDAQLAEAVQTTDPAALAPTFAAAEAGFGRALALVDQVQGDFDALEPPDDATGALAVVDRSLATLRSMLEDVHDAAAAQDVEAFASAIANLPDLDQAQLDEAARQLGAVGATACLPAA